MQARMLGVVDQDKVPGILAPLEGALLKLVVHNL